MLTANQVWVSATGQRKWLYEIDHQHYSNILWFMEVLGDQNVYKETYEIIQEELRVRFGDRLPWKPLPLEGEIEELIDRGLITVNGDIYGNSGTTLHNDKIIGTLTHITNWQKLV